MSSHLIQINRVPLIPDPRVALKASQAFSASRDQTERVLELGVSYFNLLSSIQHGIRNFTNNPVSPVNQPPSGSQKMIPRPTQPVFIARSFILAFLGIGLLGSTATAQQKFPIEN